MVKKIKHVSELPRWYQRNKYDAAQKLDDTAWYVQFLVRRYCLLYNIKEEILNLIRKNPIINLTNNLVLRTWFYGGFLPELELKNPCHALGIHHMTIRDLILAQNEITPGKQKYMQKWWNQFDGDFLSDKLPVYPHKPWIDEPIALTHNSLLLSVNLNFPHSVLIKQFEQMLQPLKNKGKINHRKNHFRKQDRKNWHRFGVLPYLDLKIWERSACVSIPRRVMADAIYIIGEGGEECVRKTTHSPGCRYANDVFGPSCPPNTFA